MVTAHTFLLTLALAAPGETVLLEFSAQWCGPCQAMQPVVQRLATTGFPVRQVDIDQHPQLASRFGVTAVPCFVMLVDGREIDRVTGGASYARLLEMYETANASRGQHQVRGQSPEKAASALAALNPLNLLSKSEEPEPVEALPPADPFATVRAEASASRSPVAHSPVAPRGSADDVIADSLAATVRIKVDDPEGHSYGTGTIIDTHGPEALVVTCGHIFRDSQGKGRISVDLFSSQGQQELPATLIHYDLQHDIGLISFVPGVAVRRAARVAPANHQLERGATVFSIGCNHGAEPSVQRSRIAAVDKYLGPPNVEVMGQPVDGRSGGGLFSDSGLLVGICNAADPQDNEGIYASLPSIHWQLDRIGQQHIYAATQLASDSPPAASPPPVSTPDPRRVPANEHVVPVSHRTDNSGDTEVICIVRSRDGKDGAGRLVILSQPSEAFLNSLASEATSSGGGLVPVNASTIDTFTESTEPLIRAQSVDP